MAYKNMFVSVKVLKLKSHHDRIEALIPSVVYSEEIQSS